MLHCSPLPVLIASVHESFIGILVWQSDRPLSICLSHSGCVCRFSSRAELLALGGHRQAMAGISYLKLKRPLPGGCQEVSLVPRINL